MKKLKIIAEIGVNHNGDIKLVKKLIDCAVELKQIMLSSNLHNKRIGTSKSCFS